MTALDQLKEDKLEYPDLQMRIGELTGNFMIENKGAPMYNAEAAYIGLIGIMAYKCEMVNFVWAEPMYFYHYAGAAGLMSSRGITERFSTSFNLRFEDAVSWFKKLRQEVGSINSYCLNSVTLTHIMKVEYDDAAANHHKRYFSASRWLQDYINKKTGRRISETGEIDLSVETPKDWDRYMRLKSSALKISSLRREVAQQYLTKARKHLIRRSGGPPPGAPPTPGGLRIKTD